MKKLNLQLNSVKEMLSKEQMKKISGGYSTCHWNYPPSAGGGYAEFQCDYNPFICEDEYAYGCSQSPNCASVTCF